MKKIMLSAMAVIMCVLMLTGCGAGSAAEGTTAAAKEVVLSDVLAEINSQFFNGGENMKPIENTDKLELYYGITPADVSDFAAEISKNSATEIDEVIIVKATDADAAARVAECLELRLQSQKDLCASYSPELLAVAEKCAVNTNGNVVSLIVTDNYSEVFALYTELMFE